MEQVNYNSGEVLESLNNKLDRDFNNMAVNSVNFAKYSNNVTNCITEIPQDIKLELVDGTLTLKAGSKIRIPNGKNSDDSLKFDEFIIETDIICTFDNTNQKMVFFHPEKTVLWHCNVSSQQFSGDTQPTTSWGYWYDTKNNIIKHTNNGSDWTTGFSLPLCIATGNDNGSATSIDQVFNGFGYIGSTVFALPGIKGLIPNGRNADGSLKNTEFVTSKVLTFTQTNTGTIPFVIRADGVFSAYSNVYDDVTNKNSLGLNCVAGTYTASSGVITSFTPKLPFHAVDRNDSSWVAQQAMPSGKFIDLSLGASGTKYTAPANGWFYIERGSKSGDKWINVSNGLYAIASTSISGVYNAKILYPVKKNDVVTVSYTVDTDNPPFRFIYAEGEK